MAINVRNLAARVGVAVVAIPVVLYAVTTGGWALATFAGVLTAVGAWEWAELAGLRRMKALYVLAILGPILLLFAQVSAGPIMWTAGLAALTPLALLAALTGPWKEQGGIRAVGATVSGVFYVGLFALMIPVGSGAGAVPSQDGGALLASALVMVWLCDTLAYFGGSTFGRHKLAPSISPNKSWEGAISGLFGAALGGWIGFHVFSPAAMALGEFLALGVLVGIFGQLGDLAESMIKRDAEVKDSSSILPGHGGVLDRFDSFLFAVVIMWVWLLARPLWYQ